VLLNLERTNNKQMMDVETRFLLSNCQLGSVPYLNLLDLI
jgi:hypothetical protein